MYNKICLTNILILSYFFRTIISNESISEITITIEGNGNQYILNNQEVEGYSFNNIPSEVIINGITKDYQNSYEYELLSEENIITIKWNYSITNCDVMFYQMTRIITIDLSKFDSSNVISMYKMFSQCTSLISLNLNNLDTSLVTDMRDIFSDCSSLKVLDLSEFKT